MPKKFLPAVIVAVVLTIPLTSCVMPVPEPAPAPAPFSDEGFCRDYATAAVRQAHEAHERFACERGIDNPARWSEDFRVHYNWCRGVAPQLAQSERDIRTHYLNECTHY